VKCVGLSAERLKTLAVGTEQRRNGSRNLVLGGDQQSRGWQPCGYLSRTQGGANVS
jgi:hypothetical protein